MTKVLTLTKERNFEFPKYQFASLPRKFYKLPSWGISGADSVSQSRRDTIDEGDQIADLKWGLERDLERGNRTEPVVSISGNQKQISMFATFFTIINPYLLFFGFINGVE